MSNISIHQRHPLHREGTSQIHLLIQALQPSSVQLDDRSMQDLIVAAHQYAQNLSFFDENNLPDGHWAPFWEVESLTYLAVIAALDTDELRKKYEDIDLALAQSLENFKPGKGKPNPAPELYRGLLDTLFDMAKGLEIMYSKLVQIKHPMQNMLLGIIKRDNQCDFEELEGALQKLVSLHKGGDDQLVHERYNIFYAGDNRWGIPDRKHYDLIKPDSKVTREKLRALFLTFFNAYLMVIHRGQQAFDAELALMDKPETEAYRLVEPHVTLFITFLRLFRHAQDSLNELTEKHLNHYYTNILCLHRKAAEPDHVHLIFTLAKNFDRELIEKGTLLLGGKDKNGQPMYYETLKDWVVTQAQIAEVKTIFLPQRFTFNLEDQEEADKFKSVLAAEFLPDGSTEHRIFGDDIQTLEAEIGFAIHSPQLLMAEGNRWIQVSIGNVPYPLFTDSIEGTASDNLAIAVSTKEGWKYLELPKLATGIIHPILKDKLFDNPNFEVFPNPAPIPLGDLGTPLEPLKTAGNLIQPCYAISHGPTNPYLHLQIFLPADFDAIEPVEGESRSSLPGVKLVLKKKQFEALGNPYYKFLTAAKHSVLIGVRAEGLSKSLIVQPDNGLMDGTQQVLPFGPTAPKGAKFYLGSREAFLKSLQTVRFNIDWVGTGGRVGSDFLLNSPWAANDGDLEVSFLKENVFSTNHHTPSNDNLNVKIGPTLFDFGRLRGTLEYNFPNLKRSKTTYQFDQFDPSIRQGFMRFTFTGNLGHSTFANRLAEALLIEAHEVDTSSPNASTNLPNPPYTPTFNSIKMDYTSLGQEMEHNIDEFYYLHPFEGYEAIPFFEKVAVSGAPPGLRDLPLFPDYTRFHGLQEIDGHLFIGVSGLKAGSNLSLLVHTSEGSERDPDRDIPLLQWAFLTKNNTWESLPSLNILSDSSFSFTRSGMIQIAIPKEISSEGNTLLNPDLHWLRVSAVEGNNRNTAALPSLLNLRTQVVEASLRLDKGLEPSHLSEGQAPKSISKLVFSRSAIKQIEQLATTFDGREAEAKGMAFYQRISARLRHRNRAITAWDFEHLLLAKFADVATAKCINHTQYRIMEATELAPGFVTLAVVPDLRKRAGTSLTNPRFPKGDLDEMRNYLNGHANMFLNQNIGDHKYLQVVNPQYEALKIHVRVKFRPEIDEAYHLEKLSNELRNYLAPWLEKPESAPVFGRNLRKSAIVRFVEERPYIDFIYFMDIYRQDQAPPLGEDIRPEAAHGILTTAKVHTVTA